MIVIQLGFSVNDHFYDYIVYDYIEDSKNKPTDDTRSNLWCGAGGPTTHRRLSHKGRRL